MTKQDALNYIREHLTALHTNPNIHEDGTCNLISALEDIVIPKLEKDIFRRKRRYRECSKCDFNSCENRSCYRKADKTNCICPCDSCIRENGMPSNFLYNLRDWA